MERLFSHDFPVLQLEIQHEEINEEVVEVLMFVGDARESVFGRVDGLAILEF